MMQPATSEELEKILGEMDAFTIGRILDIRATADEVAEALADFEDERRFGERREPTTPRISEIRQILEELIDTDDEDPVLAHSP